MIRKKFDITTGNPRKLFSLVRDSIQKEGYNTSPERGPAISQTAIRDTGTFDAQIQGVKDKRIFPFIPAIVGGVVVAIVGLIFLLFDSFIGLFILIGGIGICFYKGTLRYNISARFEGEAYYAGGNVQRVGVESVYSERASMIGEVRVYLDGWITNKTDKKKEYHPDSKENMELQQDFGMVDNAIEQNSPNLSGLKEMIGAEPSAQPALKCPHCGADVQTGWKACPACGNKLSLCCSNCGAVIQEGWKACPKCGEKMSGVTSNIVRDKVDLIKSFKSFIKGATSNIVRDKGMKKKSGKFDWYWVIIYVLGIILVVIILLFPILKFLYQ
ncbi:MAG: zinc ribbon domain-containing protein [Candidatus Thermoplasmatota archaeon]|nr:zinc ribbon domain-containing protein [Candidatus Thermoplasmatota archaeon]MBU4256240.1 zinc ribbon domain-containing protein [Candidatus Thermoplasmatota archaeon]MCG2825067.1 zinc ribbon domain-containing protein [Thermoplasmatales archaeon]